MEMVAMLSLPAAGVNIHSYLLVTELLTPCIQLWRERVTMWSRELRTPSIVGREHPGSIRQLLFLVFPVAQHFSGHWERQSISLNFFP